MANKKLKVELELETATAKRQAKELEQTTGGGGSGGNGGGPNNLAKSLDRAAKSAEKSAGAFDHMQGSAARLTRGFAGIAVGMATSYASNYVTNPNAKAALDYTGAGISGAVGGAMMAGLPGAIVGGLAGVLKTYMEKEGERSQMSKDFETGEAVYASVRRDDAKFKELSSTKGGTDIASNLSEVKKIIDNYTQTAADFVAEIREELAKANPDKEKLEKLKRNLDYSRGQIKKYEGLEETLTTLVESRKGVAYYAGTDALARVGGGVGGAPASADAGDVAGPASIGSRVKSFGFSVPVAKSAFTSFGNADLSFGDSTSQAIKEANDRIEKIDGDQLKVLEEIARNTRNKGGASWQ